MRTLFWMLCAVAATAQSLTVQRGSASRATTPGSVVHIWADPNTSTEVFTGWTGDVQFLLDPAAWHTTLVMPSTGVRLTANFRTVPAWTPQTVTIGGIGTTYVAPENPVGLVFWFHFGGGTGASQFIWEENLSVQRELVAAGFAIAAFDSMNRTTALWNTSALGTANPDLVRLNTVLQGLRSRGIVPAEIPLLALGISSGGCFAHHSASEMNWAATLVAICADAGTPRALATYSGPTFWMPARNDHEAVGPQTTAAMLQSYETMADRLAVARHVAWEPQPLYPSRLQRIGMNLEDSTEIYNLFRANQWLDANDFLIRNSTEFDWKPAIPARLSGVIADIERQLFVTHANHRFSADNEHLIRDFFLRAVNQRGALTPVNAASYVGPTVAPDSIATLFAGGLAPALRVGAVGPETELGGVSAVVRTAAGAETNVPWF